MSCVGYQSSLFPVCVNRLPHRLCLGYTPPGGVPFKTAGLWWESVFLSESYQPTVCTGHRVVPQSNLLMSAFLHLVSTFPPIGQLAADSLAESSFSLRIRVDTEVGFQSVILASAEGIGAGNMTGHTPKLSVHSCASLPPHAGLLVTCFCCCCTSNLSDLAVLCECLLWLER